MVSPAIRAFRKENWTRSLSFFLSLARSLASWPKSVLAMSFMGRERGEGKLVRVVGSSIMYWDMKCLSSPFFAFTSFCSRKEEEKEAKQGTSSSSSSSAREKDGFGETGTLSLTKSNSLLVSPVEGTTDGGQSDKRQKRRRRLYGHPKQLLLFCMPFS